MIEDEDCAADDGQSPAVTDKATERPNTIPNALPVQRIGFMVCSTERSLAVQRVFCRFGTPAILFIVFAVIVSIHAFAPALYSSLMRIWGVPAFDFPFLDLHAIFSALECKRQGIDVMQTNPCDVLGRPHSYSPLWLAAASIAPIDRHWLAPAGIGLDLLFILSLCRLPVPASAAGTLVLVAAALSPVTAYALERANADLIIFLMVMASAPLWLAPWPRRAASYAIVLLAGLLKFYPLALLILTLREPPKRFLALLATALIVIGFFYVYYRAELAEEAQGFSAFTMSPFTDAFGFCNLPYGIVALVPTLGLLTAPLGFGPEIIGHAILAWLLVVLVQRAWRISQDRELGAGLAGIAPGNATFLAVGATLITGCFFAFFAGHGNVLYRGIYFLMVLPGLLALARAAKQDPARSLLHQSVALVLFLMWSEFFRRSIDAAVFLVPSERFANTARILFWAIKELIWWRVIALFCGLLLGFVAESSTGRLLVRKREAQSTAAGQRRT